MIRQLKVSVSILALALTVACATTQVQKARQVSADVHALLASVDDAEEVVFASGAVPTWTAEKHKAFAKQMTVALKAGLALNEEVRLVPMSPQAKVDLKTVSEAVVNLEAIAGEALGPSSPVVTGLKTVDAAIVKILPLFLQ